MSRPHQPDTEPSPAPLPAPSPASPAPQSRDELGDALQRGGLDPYAPAEQVHIFDTATPAGGFALREMTDAEQDRYGDEPVRSRWDPQRGEVQSWIEPDDLDWPRWRAAQLSEQQRRTEQVLTDLEQHAAAMTRAGAGDALARHHAGLAADETPADETPADETPAGELTGGDPQVLEDAAAAARVAALDRGWDTAALLSEGRARVGDRRGGREGGRRGGALSPGRARGAVARWVGRLRAGRPSEGR